MPLLWLSLAFLSGILLAVIVQIPPAAWWGLAGLWLAGWIVRRILSRVNPFRAVGSHRLVHGVSITLDRLKERLAPLASRLPLPFELLLVFMMLGGVRYTSAQPVFSQEAAAWYNDLDTRFVVEGVVIAMPDVRDNYTNLQMRIERLHAAQDQLFRPIKGMLWVQTGSDQDWRYGDRLQLEGYLETPPEDEAFSYREYLSRQGFYSMMRNPEVHLLRHDQANPILGWILAFKQRALKVTYRLYPDPEASLLAGILLGVETGMPQDLQQAFAATGMTHIIAISGFNITIISGLFILVFGRLLGRSKGALAAAAGIGLYTILVGADASVVRAALMGGLSLLAVQFGRRQDGINSLAFVAALMALVNPNVLWDAGFQLSFTATLGLVLYADPLSQWFTRVASRFLPATAAARLAKPVGEYFLFTLAAQVLTLPVILYHFQRLSWVSLLANPLILPAQPPVMVMGGISVLAGMVFQPVGQVLAAGAWPFIVYTNRMVALLARVPAGNLNVGEIALLWVGLYYLALIGLTFFPVARSVLRRRISLAASAAAVGILAILVWRAYFIAPDGRLHITFLDVGTGEAIYIQSPEGRRMLLNGGPSTSRLSDALGRRMPLNDRSLDFLVVSGGESAQLGALPRLIDRVPPDNVLWAGPTFASPSARALQQGLVAAEILVIQAQTGQALDLGKGIRLKVLGAGSRGAVFLLEWDHFRLLLPLGITLEMIDALDGGQTVGPVTALLLADNGYAPSNPPDWLGVLHPQLVVLSVGAGDPQGLPDPALLESLQGYSLLRTDRNGWIELITDGEQMEVKVEK